MPPKKPTKSREPRSDIRKGSVGVVVDELKAPRFRNIDISVLFSEIVGTKDFAHEKDPKAPEEATVGGGHINMSSQQGKVGWAILWLLGVPIPILLLLFLMRGCT